MKYIQFNAPASGEEIKLAYSDYGKGQPIVLLHGWPLSREMWEYQINDFVEAGYRVIKYDRRGFGSSSKPWDGYDYDTLTEDLNEVIEQLDLSNAILVGFSMGGGEVAKYIAKYGTKRVSGIVLISSILPYMLKTNDNPEGVDASVFEDMMKQMKDDRIGFLEGFGKKFFGIGMLKKPVSEPLLSYYLSLQAKATARSTQECAKSFSSTDFRNDIDKLTLPVLIIHGDEDKTVPIDASSNRTAKLLPHAQYIVYEGAPHGLFYTHKEKLNADLINFFKTVGTQKKTNVRQTQSIS